MLVGRLLRRVLALLIRLLFVNRLVTIGLVALLLIAFVILPLLSSAAGLASGGRQEGSQPLQAAAGAFGAGSRTSATAQSLPPDPAVETYVKGVVTYDADLMWSALHPQLRQQLQSQNVTIATLKTQAAQEQRAGVLHDKVHYIGGIEGPSGLRYYFYVISASGRDSSGQVKETEGAFTFTVIPDGGIVDIGIK